MCRTPVPSYFGRSTGKTEGTSVSNRFRYDVIDNYRLDGKQRLETTIGQYRLRRNVSRVITSHLSLRIYLFLDIHETSQSPIKLDKNNTS